jgi:hypothetical protein
MSDPSGSEGKSMWLVPTKKKWRSWSLPSKLTAIGTYIGAGGVFLSLFMFMISSWVKPAPALTHLEAKLMLRYEGFQVQVLNQDAAPAKQVTLSLKTWQINAPGPDIAREFEIRDLAPEDDTTFHIEPQYLTGESGYDEERVARPTCGYIVVRSVNGRKPRAWAFFMPGQGQKFDQKIESLFYEHHGIWPLVEFEYPRRVPQVGECIDYPEGVCEAVGHGRSPWKP